MIRNCKVCGEEFNGVANQVYCTATCRKISRRQYWEKQYEERRIAASARRAKKPIDPKWLSRGTISYDTGRMATDAG